MATEKAEQIKLRMLAMLDQNRQGLSSVALARIVNDNIDPRKETVSEKSITRYLQDMESKFEVERSNAGKPILWKATPLDDRNRKQRSLNSQNFALVALGDMVSGLPPKAAEVLKKLAKDAQEYLDSKNQKGGSSEVTWSDRFKTFPGAFQLKSPTITNPTLIDNIKDAVFTQRQMDISYISRSGRRTDIRNFHPLAHLHIGHTGYVVGYDAQKGSPIEIKLYAVQRFIKADILPSNYPATVPDGFTVEKFIKESPEANFIGGPKHVVRLRVWGWLIPILKESAISDDMNILSDAADNDHPTEAIITATVITSWQFEHWILSCGEAIEVLEPAWLRAKIGHRFLLAASRYSEGE